MYTVHGWAQPPAPGLPHFGFPQMGFPPLGFAPPGYGFHGHYPPGFPMQGPTGYPQDPSQGNQASGSGEASGTSVP
jgi:hypothetical protein